MVTLHLRMERERDDDNEAVGVVMLRPLRLVLESLVLRTVIIVVVVGGGEVASDSIVLCDMLPAFPFSLYRQTVSNYLV
jgi:hypothetical protein